MVFFRRLWLPTTLMIATVVASNIAVQFPINDWLTWGAVTYPVSFLITDLTNRRYGPTDARRVAYVGFAIAVALSFHFADWRIATASALPSSVPSFLMSGSSTVCAGRHGGGRRWRPRPWHRPGIRQSSSRSPLPAAACRG